MRTLCLIPSMEVGGAERVMAQLAAHFLARGPTALLTWEAPGTAPFYPLPPDLVQIQGDRLGGGRLAWAAKVLSRPQIVRNTIRTFRPDAVISFMDTMNVIAVAGTRGTGVPVIVSERNDPVASNDRARRLLRDIAYRHADRIVVQTARIGAALPASLQPRIAVIGNPIALPAMTATPARPLPDGRFRILSIGRLVPQKDHAVLVEAFARIAAALPLWDLVIIGAGEERAALEARVAVSGLAGRVYLTGTKATARDELAQAHIFVLPSRYEGFPNALAEALAAGLPAIAFRSVHGVDELIGGGAGIAVERSGDAAANLADALRTLAADGDRRAALGSAGRARVAAWSPEHVFAAWDGVVDAAIAARAARR